MTLKLATLLAASGCITVLLFNLYVAITLRQMYFRDFFFFVEHTSFLVFFVVLYRKQG
jgi:hypothetical protein